MRLTQHTVLGALASLRESGRKKHNLIRLLLFALKQNSEQDLHKGERASFHLLFVLKQLVHSAQINVPADTH